MDDSTAKSDLAEGEAKQQKQTKTYLDKNPVYALCLMKYRNLKDSLSNIAVCPFHVHYASKQQAELYRAQHKNPNFFISIDATTGGSMISPLMLPNGANSEPIFSYIILGHSDNGSTPIGQMLSETHFAPSLEYWLREWIENFKLPLPREVVCSGAKEMLVACVRVFAENKPLHLYADSLFADVMPTSYIRIDATHFLKKYCNFLKAERVAVKIFYLTCVGKLIMCRSKDDARKLIAAIMAVAMSDYDGLTASGEESYCQKQKMYLLSILKTPNDIDEVIEQVIQGNCAQTYAETEDEEEEETEWMLWAFDIMEEVEDQRNKHTGQALNAYYLPKFFEFFIRDLCLLPLWSCVVRDKFGYGRIPASSAEAQCEFKNIKNVMLKDETLPIRADHFVEKHIEYLNRTLRPTKE